ADSGFVGSAVYSTLLNGERKTHGTFLFRDIDTKMCSGGLKRHLLSTVTTARICNEINIAFIGITTSGETKSNQVTDDGFALPAIIDTGTEGHKLPRGLAQRIGTHLGVTMELTYCQQTYLLVDCAYTQNLGTTDFSFGDTTIRIPFRNLILKRHFASPHCVLSAVSFPHEDRNKGELWLSRADNYNSNIAPISKGKDIVPIQLEECPVDMCPANYTTPKLKMGFESKSNSNSYQTSSGCEWSLLSWIFFGSGSTKGGSTVQSSEADGQLSIDKTLPSDAAKGPCSNYGSPYETTSDKTRPRHETPQCQPGEVVIGAREDNSQHTTLLETQNKHDNRRPSKNSQILYDELSQPVSEAIGTRIEQNYSAENNAENGRVSFTIPSVLKALVYYNRLRIPQYQLIPQHGGHIAALATSLGNIYPQVGKKIN
ncbi:hypothetical protein BGZ60DRAFT_543432, partial [Tricladium varicosporioides]